MSGGVVFDLDGTLVDSAPGIRAATDAVLAAAGRRPLRDGEVEGFIGEGVARLLERAFAATGGVPARPPVAAWKSAYAETSLTGTRQFDGVRDVLDTLRRDGVPMALCTNKPQRPTEYLLDALALDHFSVVHGGDALPWCKPDARHLTTTLRDLGVDTGVFVGDSPTDAFTAEAAIVPFVLVSWGYSRVPRENLPASERVADVAVLRAAIDACLAY